VKVVAYCAGILKLGAVVDRHTARRIADSLTWLRIVSVVPITILAWYGLAWWVFGLYIAGALTDYFDGVFARRAAPPKTDTDLDGIADIVFRVMTVLWIWLLVPGFIQKYWLPYLPILVALEVYMIALRARHPDMVVPHYPFGRFAMALFFFLLPVLIVWGDVTLFVHAVLIIGTASNAQLAWGITRLATTR
jgi:phosphatidylglycerophosphate synthase